MGIQNGLQTGTGCRKMIASLPGFRFCMGDSAAAVPRRSILRVSVQESTDTESTARNTILRVFMAQGI